MKQCGRGYIFDKKANKCVPFSEKDARQVLQKFIDTNPNWDFDAVYGKMVHGTIEGKEVKLVRLKEAREGPQGDVRSVGYFTINGKKYRGEQFIELSWDEAPLEVEEV